MSFIFSYFILFVCNKIVTYLRLLANHNNYNETRQTLVLKWNIPKLFCKDVFFFSLKISFAESFSMTWIHVSKKTVLESNSSLTESCKSWLQQMKYDKICSACRNKLTRPESCLSVSRIQPNNLSSANVQSKANKRRK